MMPFTAEWYAEMRGKIDEKHRADLAALELVYQMAKDFGLHVEPEPLRTQANIEDEVIALLEAGHSMASIGRRFHMSWGDVRAIRTRWRSAPVEAIDESRTGPGREVVLSPLETSHPDIIPPSPASVLKSNEQFFDEPEEGETANSEVADDPVKGGVDETDTYHKPISAAELDAMRDRVEAFLRRNGPASYRTVIQECRLSPGQFAAVQKVADIESVSGFFRIAADSIAAAPIPAPVAADEERRSDGRSCHRKYDEGKIKQFAQWIERFLRENGPQPYSAVLKGANLSPHQFNETIPHANIEKIDGLWQTKVRLDETAE